MNIFHFSHTVADYTVPHWYRLTSTSAFFHCAIQNIQMARRWIFPFTDRGEVATWRLDREGWA